MTKAIITCFHKYTPFGEFYYQPIFDYFKRQMEKYKDEYDKLYIIEDTVENANLRYYDQYKKILPEIKEDLVLFLDSDMVIYRKGIIQNIFMFLNGKIDNGEKSEPIDIVSIYDSCGTYKTDKLNGGNKFCPYLFATSEELLMKYRDLNWGPNMPEWETLGLLTQRMLEDGRVPFEMEEDKNSIYFNGIKDGEKGKDLGYYHIRAGSTPAVLLAWRNSPEHNHTYQEYIKNQPKSEYLRQIAWYWIMCENDNRKIMAMLNDMNVNPKDWYEYIDKFNKYHNLP